MSRRPTNTDEVLIDAARAHVRRLFGPAGQTECVMVRVRGVPDLVTLPVPVPWWEQAAPRAECRHSPDFRSACWFGVDYTFSPTQAAVVRQLWEAWEDGTPDVGQETLVEGAGSEAGRVRDLFRGHPAWQAMIGSEAKGTYRLIEPG